MDDFNDFFDDQRGTNYERTPIYHTPEPKKNSSKNNFAIIFSIVLACIMCVVVIVNVIVLASLKNSIASEYADSMAQTMREQYEKAISEQLANTDIVSDIVDEATKKALDAMDSTVGEIAENYAKSVCRLYMFESSSSVSSASGIATAFLISDTNEDGTEGRYLVTNAHCVRYTAKVSSIGFQSTYQWRSYSKILCKFEGEENYFNAEIIAYGGYNDTDNRVLSENQTQADLALLRIKGTQPTNEAHPSLKILAAGTSVTRGTPVALIGNPEGIGDKNSITSGTVTLTGIQFEDNLRSTPLNTVMIAGDFVMTDAAVNGGNSGGPMIDRRGVVVGVVESKFVSDDIDNMGFAISAKTLNNFLIWASSSENNSLKKDLTINYSFA